MPDGLAMRRHQIGLNPGLPERQRGGAGECLAEQHVDFAHFVDAALLGAEQGKDALAQVLVEWKATAAVYTEPGLVDELTRPLDADLGLVPAPDGS
jgi:hypothetical protein